LHCGVEEIGFLKETRFLFGCGYKSFFTTAYLTMLKILRYKWIEPPPPEIMLAYLLAFLIGSGSLGLYLSTFLLPEVTRKSDLFWSGVGMFYAWVLWVCAGRITGGLLLGQLAGVSLLGWLGWQLLDMRWQQIPPDRRSHLPQSPAAFTELLRDRLYQLQTSLQKSSWQSSSLNYLSTFAEKFVSVAIVLLGWSAALIGTTVKTWEQSVPPPFDPPEIPQIDPESSPINNQKPL
jgi:hypothetical protein